MERTPVRADYGLGSGGSPPTPPRSEARPGGRLQAAPLGSSPETVLRGLTPGQSCAWPVLLDLGRWCPPVHLAQAPRIWVRRHSTALRRASRTVILSRKGTVNHPAAVEKPEGCPCSFNGP